MWDGFRDYFLKTDAELILCYRVRSYFLSYFYVEYLTTTWVKAWVIANGIFLELLCVSRVVVRHALEAQLRTLTPI